MRASLFYTVMVVMIAAITYIIWEYRTTPIPVADLEATKVVSPTLRSDIPQFRIDKYEVTNGKYWRFDKSHTYDEGKEDFPVVRVTWHEAAAYARWAGKRLPTAAEWEYAMQAGKNDFVPWDAIEPWPLSVDPPEFQLFRVGRLWRDRTPLGIVNMAGNAWEWTADTLRLADGTLAAVVKGGFVLRNEELHFSTPDFSDTVAVDTRSDRIGFRCVRQK